METVPPMHSEDHFPLPSAKARARWSARASLLVLGVLLFAGGMGYVGWSNRPLPPLRYPQRALPTDNGYVRLVETLNRISPLPRVTPLRRPMEAPLPVLREAVEADREDLTELRRLLGGAIVRPHLADFPLPRCHEALLLLTAQSRLERESGHAGKAFETALDAVALSAVVGREVDYRFGFFWTRSGEEAARTYLPYLTAVEARTVGRRLEEILPRFPEWKDCVEQLRLETLLQARHALTDSHRFGQVLNLEEGDTPWGALRDRALLSLYPRASGYEELERWYAEVREEAAQPFPRRRYRSYPRGWFPYRLQNGMPTDEMPELNRARLELLRLQLALHEYRLRRGRYPADLAALAPEILAVLPTDPFTGDPYRYRRRGGVYLLYSVGPNGLDENGKPFPKETSPRHISMPTRRDAGDLVVEQVDSVPGRLHR